MDFECSHIDVPTDSDTLKTRGLLWLVYAILKEYNYDFDYRLYNQLRLLTNVINDVIFDINSLIDARVLCHNNDSHKKSLCSLLYWLYHYIDARPSLMQKYCHYLETLVSKIIQQIKIYPTVFCTAFYKNSLATTFYASIRFSKFQSHRLRHILDFDKQVQTHDLNQGMLKVLFKWTI